MAKVSSLKRLYPALLGIDDGVVPSKTDLSESALCGLCGGAGVVFECQRIPVWAKSAEP